MQSDAFPGAEIRRALRDGSSFSGNERDHLWLQSDSGRLVEVSSISGLDHTGDGRAWARLDVNQDGGPDVVTVSANTPALQLFENQVPARGGFVAIRLEGGNTRPAAAAEWSARDAFGARVVVFVQGRALHRELRAGEGMAGQSSRTLLVGVGNAATVERVEVRWPSGRVSTVDDVEIGTLTKIFERDDIPPERRPYGPVAVQ